MDAVRGHEVTFLLGFVSGVVTSIAVMLAGLLIGPVPAQAADDPWAAEVAVLPQPEPSVMKIKIPCTRSVTVAAPDYGTTVRFVQSKRCGGPVGSFTATDDMSFVLLTQIPGQRPVTHRLRIEVAR